MDPDYRSRHGQSYISARRRINRTVANTLHVNTVENSNSEFQLNDTFSSDTSDVYQQDVQDMQSRGDCEPLDYQFQKPVNADMNEALTDCDDCNSYANYFGWSSSDSESETCDETADIPPINVQLSEWAVEHGIRHSAINSLLSILKPFHSCLPTDARTLLKTPQTYEIKQINGTKDQQYSHFGIVAGISQLLSMSYVSYNNLLTLQFNFDGLPLFKSSSMEFWPILCLVKQFDGASPFVVGLYCGTKKPSSVADYVQDFVNELLNVLDNGIIFEEKHYDVEVGCFVCDAPARAFIKNVKSHTGYFGCDKCTQEGVYINNRMTFPETTAALRTDDDFKRMTDDAHHRGPCPLSVLPVGLVTTFVFDYMHLVCLGVVRKLLKFWLSGTLRKTDTSASRLPSHSVTMLSNRLVNLASFTPQEFARRPRSVSDIDRWKATEFRQFLLYSGPVILSGILTENVYNHFMLLFTGITLLASPVFCLDHENVDYAHSLLCMFVQLAGSLYSSDFLVYNVHGLTHLAEDVKRHGCLDNFSAFPFENELKTLKGLVRKAGNPLAQCIRRLSEQRSFSSHTKSAVDFATFVPSVEHNCGPIPFGFEDAMQFMKLKASKFKLNVKRSPADSCVSIRDKGPVLVVNVLLQHKSMYVVCQQFKRLSDLFVHPLPSSKLGIYKASGLSKELFVASVSDIASKCFCFCCDVDMSDKQYNVFPIMHTSATPI